MTSKIPVSSSPIESKAPVDKSMEELDEQPGHSSVTVAVTDSPFAVLVMTTVLPQYVPEPYIAVWRAMTLSLSAWTVPQAPATPPCAKKVASPLYVVDDDEDEEDDEDEAADEVAAALVVVEDEDDLAQF